MPRLVSWLRHQTLLGGELLTVKLRKKKLFELHWNWHDKVRENSRAFVSLGWDRGENMYGILFQHYREGYKFDPHTDGPKTNRVVTLVLRRPTLGGDFYCDGPHKRWLGSRVIVFDGGAETHGVTKILRGSRSVLMFQRGRWK